MAAIRNERDVRCKIIIIRRLGREYSRGQLQPGRFVERARGNPQIGPVIPVPEQAGAAIAAKSPPYARGGAVPFQGLPLVNGDVRAPGGRGIPKPAGEAPAGLAMAFDDRPQGPEHLIAHISAQALAARADRRVINPPTCQ